MKFDTAKNIFPLYIEGTTLVYAKGNSVFRGGFDLSDPILVGKYNAGLIKNALARTNFGSRIGRLGFHGLHPFQGGYLGIQKGNIVFKKGNESIFENVFSGFRGSRPLNLYVAPAQDWACFGEYFGNMEREEVHIFSTTNGTDWEVAHTFPPKSIRHVHGIIDDPHRNGIWVLTGDSDTESALWFTNDRFKTLTKVVTGSQKARAVEIIPTEEGLIVPMDSPLEKNFINFYNTKENVFEPLSSLAGSAFHAIKTNGLYFVTTVTEPSEINLTGTANVYASLNGKDWKCISKFKKDFVPIKYQGITRYSEIIITPGENNTDFIIGYARAVKGGNFMVRWEKQGIVDFIR